MQIKNKSKNWFKICLSQYLKVFSTGQGSTTTCCDGVDVDEDHKKKKNCVVFLGNKCVLSEQCDADKWSVEGSDVRGQPSQEVSAPSYTLVPVPLSFYCFYTFR